MTSCWRVFAALCMAHTMVVSVAATGGACCLPDATCVEVSSSYLCDATFLSRTACSTGLCVYELTPYVDPLYIPEEILPGNFTNGVPHYEISVTQVTQVLHSELPNGTVVWGFNGRWPGPTITATANEPTAVTVKNALKNEDGTWMRQHYFAVPNCTHGADFWGSSPRVVSHLHGAHALAAMDGHPDYTLLPGEEATYVYSNKQVATTLWYHDHALGITRLNIYMGLAGAYVISDEVEESLNLPSGDFDVPLIMQDRSLNPDGSLAYPDEWVSIFKGNMMAVNGVFFPYFNVCQGKYRFRIVNGGNGLTFKLVLNGGAEFILIGTDGGLIEAPLALGPQISIASAERMQVVIDFEQFSAGTEITMTQNTTINGRAYPNLMKFIVQPCEGHTDDLPQVLVPFEKIPESESTNTHELLLYMYVSTEECNAETWLIDGLGWDAISIYIPIGETNTFIFVNPLLVTHPMHIHLTQFQVVGRQAISPIGNSGNYTTIGPWRPPPDYEVGWKDVVEVHRRERVKVIGRFTDYAGRFPYHCHIASHEDNEMMRQLRVTMRNCNNNGVCDFGEDCFSCPDCPSLGGQKCGNKLCETGDGENCVNCPEDCAGLQDGSEASFCCGGDDNPGINPLPCSNSACLNTELGRFCKVTANVPACCGDEVCEGQETMDNCPVDCKSASPMYHATVG